MSDSKSGSKSDLNESTLPLIETEEKQGDTPEKEVQEMELEEKKDESEKEVDKEDSAKDKKDKKEKKKKEKKEKVKKEGPGCLTVRTAELNMADRDAANINDEINIDFDGVLAEPRAVQGLDPVWRLSFLLFTQTRLWVYRLIAAMISLPLSVLWGLVFSLVTVSYVWALKPVIRLVQVALAICGKVLRSAVDALVSPVTESLGLVLAGIRINSQRTVMTA